MPTVNNRLFSIFTTKPVNNKPVHSLNIPAEISLKPGANINPYGRPAIPAGWAGKFVNKTVRATANSIAYCHSTVKEWITCFGEKLISRQCRSLTQTEQLIEKFRQFDRLDDDDLETVSTQENEERYKQCAMLSQFILGCERQDSLCQSNSSHSASTISLKGLFCLSLLALSGLCGATGNLGIQNNNQYLFKLSYVPYGRNKSKSKDLLLRTTMCDKKIWNVQYLYFRKVPSKFNVQVLNDTTGVPLELVKCIKGEHEPRHIRFSNENALAIENNSCNYIVTKYSSTTQIIPLKLFSTSDGENHSEQEINLWLEFNMAIRMHEISSLVSLLVHFLNKNKKRKALGTPFHVNNVEDNAEECQLRLQIFKAIRENRKTSKRSIKRRINTIAKKILKHKQDINPVTKNFVFEMLANPTKFNIKDTDVLNAAGNYRQFQNISSDDSNDDVSQAKLLQYYRTVLKYLFNELTLSLNSAPVTINFNQLNLAMTHYVNFWGKRQTLLDMFVRRNSRDLAEKKFIITPIMKRLPKQYLNNSKLFSATQNLRPTYAALNYDYARHGAAPRWHFGFNYAKLNNSIKNRIAYCLPFNLNEKYCGKIPLPTTDIKNLILDLMNSSLSKHEELLKSVINSIFSPKWHAKAVNKNYLQPTEYIECIIFDNIDMRNHFSELHYFTDNYLTSLSDKELIRLTTLKHQGKIPCELFIDEHKIQAFPNSPIVPIAHLDGVDGEARTLRLVEQLISREKFKRLSPEDSEIRQLGQDDVCPISLDSLQTIPRIISYTSGGRICRISESAILSAIRLQGIFRCPFTREVLITDFGPCPAATMTVQIVGSANPFSKTRYYKISYDIYPGFQTQRHRNPGIRYPGDYRVAYLPKTDVGAKLCYMLRVAFAKRLTFTVGWSLTRGVDNVVVWNDIHHKTSIYMGAFALRSDPGYLARLRGELEEKGIQYPEQTPDDSELTTFLDNYFEEHLIMKRTEQARTLSETATSSSVSIDQMVCGPVEIALKGDSMDEFAVR